MPYQPPAYDPDAEGDFGPIKPGPYDAVVEALELRYGQESGKAYVAWTFTLADGEFKNRKVWNNTSLVEKAINMPSGWWPSIRAAAGEEAIAQLNKEWEAEEDMAEAAADIVCGRMVRLLVTNRIFEGKPQNDVTAIKAFAGEQLGGNSPARAPASPAAAKRGRKNDMEF